VKVGLDYNNKRLHSALGYIAHVDKLHGREKQIFADRDRKLEQARKRRKEERQRRMLEFQRTVKRVNMAS
jgi:hypothetical protein